MNSPLNALFAVWYRLQDRRSYRLCRRDLREPLPPTVVAELRHRVTQPGTIPQEM